MKINNADLEAVLALEEPAKTLLMAIKAALPALERLEKVNYAGADWVSQVARQTTDDSDDGSLAHIVNALAMFREAAGDRGAFDFAFYVGYLDQTVYEAIEHLVSIDEVNRMVPRIKAMRAHAAAVER